MLNLNIPLQKLFGWFRRPQLWATSDWQFHHNNVSAHASHLVQRSWQNIKSPRWLTRPPTPYSPDLTPCNFWLFSKVKSPLKGKRFVCWWDSGKYSGAADGNWENCVRSQRAYFEGDWGIIVLCTMFLVSCVFNKCFYFFMLHGWIPSGQTLYI